MKRIVIISQSGTLMPTFAELAARQFGQQIEWFDLPDQPYPTLQHHLKQREADLYLLGYPHTDHAILFARERGETAQITQGANMLLRRGDSLIAEDSRAMGLYYALQYRGVETRGRVLVIGKQSAAFAAALACERLGFGNIDILNPCGNGNDERQWRGVREPMGHYSLIINTMRESGYSAEQLEGNFERGVRVIDLVYTPRCTRLLIIAQQRGCDTENGVLAAAFRTSIAVASLCGVPLHELPETKKFASDALRIAA